ncbi:paraquat-inducible protein A [Neisseriaceae bacterium ESL0693]|nr:paraquat-inducible protein A [Neisseriaceae bacterium ESL0693]
MTIYRKFIPAQSDLRRHQSRIQPTHNYMPAHEVGCPCCGLSLTIPRLQPGNEAHCPRCHEELVRIEKQPLATPLALACASLIIMLLVYTQLYLTVDLAGLHVDLSVPSMMSALTQQNFAFLAEVMFLLTFGSPLLFILLCLYVYFGLKYRHILPYMLYATRAMVRLRHWMMVDVFFIATLVAYIKMHTLAQIHFGMAFWLTLVLAILLIATARSVPEHWIFYQIQCLRGHDPTKLPHHGHTISCHYCLFEQPDNQLICSVCGSILYLRKPFTRRISMALLLTAIILYFPANLLPMMITRAPGTNLASTIFDGIKIMWTGNDKLIAVIIFSASMAIPVLKMISMLLLLYSVTYKPLMSSPRLTLLYRITESIGRWSMIDIFVVIILMSAFCTPLAQVSPGGATIYFCSVVLFTMVSAMSFDSRLLWDQTDQPRLLLPSVPFSKNNHHES